MKTKIIVTNIPAFYKINMYNELSRKVKLYVIFTDANDYDRNKDFVSGKINFQHIILSGFVLKKLLYSLYILKKTRYDELILGGWDNIILWVLAFISPQSKNSLFIESSFLESTTFGAKGLIKRLFVRRLSKVYASGKSQKKVTDNLGFTGNTIITKGVGVFNYIKQPAYSPRKEVKKFFYVGRFVEVKNLKFLISVFNELPHYELFLAGFGEQEEELRSIAKENVHIIGPIENKLLYSYYQQMDVFVLPSKIEPWGLVVEEALNNGLPVIVSDRVGCAEEIINESNGIVFKYDSKNSLINAINTMTDIHYYNSLRLNISKLNFQEIEQKQINCYVE